MKNKKTNLIANKLVNAFLKNKIISPIPKNLPKNLLRLKSLKKFVKTK